jgi:hypothetical protein
MLYLETKALLKFILSNQRNAVFWGRGGLGVRHDEVGEVVRFCCGMD